MRMSPGCKKSAFAPIVLQAMYRLTFILQLESVCMLSEPHSRHAEYASRGGNQLNYITTAWTCGYVIGQIPSKCVCAQFVPYPGFHSLAVCSSLAFAHRSGFPRWSFFGLSSRCASPPARTSALLSPFVSLSVWQSRPSTLLFRRVAFLILQVKPADDILST